MISVLCVEDNIQVQALNKKLLEDKGFTVISVMTLAEAREAVKRDTPGLIILDIHLPDGNGLDFLRELRKTSKIPVIALTNNKEEQDIVEGLASGCDDYIPKPYSFSILSARIDAVLRRTGRLPEIITKGVLTLNPLAGQAFINGTDLGLKPKEFALLLLFAENEGRVMDAEFIYTKVWNAPLADGKQTLQKRVSDLRSKLEDGGADYTISMIYGEGYTFERG